MSQFLETSSIAVAVALPSLLVLGLLLLSAVLWGLALVFLLVFVLALL